MTATVASPTASSSSPDGSGTASGLDRLYAYGPVDPVETSTSTGSVSAVSSVSGQPARL